MTPPTAADVAAVIISDIGIDASVFCDPTRIAQMLSNLLVHGAMEVSSTPGATTFSFAIPPLGAAAPA